MHTDHRERVPSRWQAGFSLIELLVVMIMILIMAAVAMPSILGYMRHYKIRGGAQQLAGELSAARLKAISRGGSFGVLLVVLSDQQYRWVILDDVDRPGDATPQTLDVLLAQADQVGPLRALPTRIHFDPAGANTSAVGFSRLGAQCQAGGPLPRGCGDLTGGPAVNYVTFAPTGASVVIIQEAGAQRRVVNVSPGGRVTLTEQ